MATILLLNRKFYDVQIIETDGHALYLRVDDKHIRIPWEACSAALANASAIEREMIEIAPSSYGLHWPLLDEDLAIAPLLASTHVTEATALDVG